MKTTSQKRITPHTLLSRYTIDTTVDCTQLSHDIQGITGVSSFEEQNSALPKVEVFRVLEGIRRPLVEVPVTKRGDPLTYLDAMIEVGFESLAADYFKDDIDF